ncbi:unnamed protein product [Echinostoma caproni]|uniref:FAS1 domain-containing protein n=1 Tax=Echinostoma caproni TaxID=27848 RepID=A0A183AXV6_9TREM|nr:unnamed protein product [Echinostoma caproni]
MNPKRFMKGCDEEALLELVEELSASARGRAASPKLPWGHGTVCTLVEIVQPDLEASNGIMHVLDNVQLTPEADNYFISYLTKQSDLTTSAELWTSLGSDPKYMAILNQQWNRKEIYSTFFIVTNDGWSKVPPEQMQLLRSNMSLLVSVLANHYMPNQLLYSEWTPVQYTINFFTGFPSDPTGTDISQLGRGAMRRLLNGTGTRLFLTSTRKPEKQTTDPLKPEATNKILTTCDPKATRDLYTLAQ